MGKTLNHFLYLNWFTQSRPCTLKTSVNWLHCWTVAWTETFDPTWVQVIAAALIIIITKCPNQAGHNWIPEHWNAVQRDNHKSQSIRTLCARVYCLHGVNHIPWDNMLPFNGASSFGGTVKYYWTLHFHNRSLYSHV